MSACPKCGGMTGVHHSILPGCMCDFANSIQETYAQKFVSSVKPMPKHEMSKQIAWLNPDVAYEQICPEIGYEATICEQHPRDLGWIPLYAHREWVGMTEDEVYRIAVTLEGEHWKKISDAIEAKLKEKNT